MCSTWLPTVLGEITSRCGDLLVGEAARQQPQHLDLARRQARPARSRRRGTRWPAAPSTASTASASRRPAVTSARSSAAASPAAARRPMGTRLAHRLVGVGGAEHPRRAARSRRRRGRAGSRSRPAARGAGRRSRRAAPAPRDWWSMRSVRYGCRRTRSHSPRAERPGLVPDRVRDSRAARGRARARRAAASARRASASPSRCPASAARSATALRVTERVRRLQVDEVRDRDAAPRRSCSPASTTASAGSASITASQVPTVVEPGQDHLAVVAHQSRHSAGSNCLPRRSRASSRAASTPPDAVGHLGVLGQLRQPGRHRHVVAARARPASPCRPTARRPRRAPRPPRPAGSSCSASDAAMAAWWSIMPSTSRWPERANSSPTRKRCSGGRPAPTIRMPGRDHAQAARLVVVLGRTSARCRRRTTWPARGRRCGSPR